MTLQEQLIEVAKKVGGVEKGGTNSAQNYKYVKATDVVQKTKAAFLEAGLFVSVGIARTRVDILPRGDKPQGVLYTVEGEIIVMNDKGDTITRGVAGSGIDFGGDKGLYKAITGAWKYGLRTLLQIPDEADDPEVERPDEKETAPTAVRGRTPHVSPESHADRDARARNANPDVTPAGWGDFDK